jgi:hypothetical protein
MSETYTFGIHWMHRRALFYDELSATSTEEARDYFNRHKRDDVALIRVDQLNPAGLYGQGSQNRRDASLCNS